MSKRRRRAVRRTRPLDRLVARSRNPRRRRISVKQWKGASTAQRLAWVKSGVPVSQRRTRRRNPRPRLYVLIARKGQGVKLKYMGGLKFATQGHPVLFRSLEGAKVVAKLIRLQVPMFRRYAFYARS